ncbi:MAG: type VI secretion system tip protein VgrG, partial [Xanthomonadaceae bacterium]|nr:type VI secretion system tip protein VgrG [Xanthomonadaceae bacterium]
MYEHPLPHDALTSQLQLDDAQRLYRIDLPGGERVLVDRWYGSERLSDGFQWHVEVLSPRADLPLEAWLGCRARLWTRLSDGSETARTGLVREAVCQGGDGGLARYRLELVPWTWLLRESRHSR